MEKSLRKENQKRKKVPGKKREKKEDKKKNRPKEERKSTILSRKEITFFVKATGTGEAPRCPDFEQEIAGKPKFASLNKVSFSLCEYQPWHKNINNRLES